MEIIFYILILYTATSLNSSANSSSVLGHDAGRSLGQNKRELQVAMGRKGEQGWVSISQQYVGATRTYREEKVGPGVSAIVKECPATILIAEEAAENVCGVPGSLKWNSPFQGYEASPGHTGGN